MGMFEKADGMGRLCDLQRELFLVHTVGNALRPTETTSPESSRAFSFSLPTSCRIFYCFVDMQ
jgi:hypothetical protein